MKPTLSNWPCLCTAAAAPPPQVVVHNLPWSTTWQQLKDLFKEWKVERADVVYDTWGKSRCVAWPMFFFELGLHESAHLASS